MQFALLSQQCIESRVWNWNWNKKISSKRKKKDASNEQEEDEDEEDGNEIRATASQNTIAFQHVLFQSVGNVKINALFELYSYEHLIRPMKPKFKRNV